MRLKTISGNGISLPDETTHTPKKCSPLFELLLLHEEEVGE